MQTNLSGSNVPGQGGFALPSQPLPTGTPIATNPTAGATGTSTWQAGQQTFQTLNTRTAGNAQPGAFFMLRRDPLRYDPDTSDLGLVAPAERLTELRQVLLDLRPRIGDPAQGPANEASVRRAFDLLSSLETHRTSTFLRSVQSTLQDMYSECTQPWERARWQGRIDEFDQRIIPQLEGSHLGVQAARNPAPYAQVRLDFAAVKQSLSATPPRYGDACDHIDAMATVLSGRPNNGADHADLLNALVHLNHACEMGTGVQQRLCAVRDLAAQLPADAPPAVQQPLGAAAAAQTLPAPAAPGTWPPGHCIGKALAAINAMPATTPPVIRNAHVSQQAGIGTSLVHLCLRIARSTPPWRDAINHLCWNIERPTRVDAAALANEAPLSTIYEYQNTTNRDADGRIPRPNVSANDSKLLSRWRTLLWGRISDEPGHTASIGSAIRAQVDNAGGAGIPISSITAQGAQIVTFLHRYSGKYEKVEINGDTRIRCRTPEITDAEILSKTLQWIEGWPVETPFSTSDLLGLGLELSDTTLSRATNQLLIRAQPPIRRVATGIYERIAPPDAPPPAKRQRKT